MLISLLLSAHALFTAAPPPWSEPFRAALEPPLLLPGTVAEEVGAFVRARVPKLELPSDAGAWDTEQARLRQQFLDELVFRGVPESWRSGPVRVEWSEVLNPAPEYEIRKLRYEALPGLWIPAIIYFPVGLAGKAPAVLNVNGHVGPPGKAHEEEQIRCINLAKRGIISIHPEWLSFGELHGDGYSHNRLAYLDLVGTSGLSVFYLNMKRAVDVLESMPEVEAGRIGMTGLSGGGWQTILLSALDTRIAATAPNAGYIGIDVRTEHAGDIGDLEQVPSDILKIGDYTHLTAMLAPRPALIILNAKDECCFQAGHTVPAVFDPIVPWYALYDAVDRFSFHVNEDPGTHNYGQDNRQAFYRFLKQHLVPEGTWTAEDIPLEADEMLTVEQLNVGLPPHNASLTTLATALFEGQAAPAIPARSAEGFGEWQATQRRALRELLALEELRAEVPSGSEMPLEGVTLRCAVTKIGGSWSVPVVIAQAAGASPQETVIILSDEGYAKDGAQMEALVQAGKRVVAVDLSFLGQAKPGGNSYQPPMLVNATGARALGIQVAELLAIAQWVRSEFGVERPALQARGWNASVAALMAAALDAEHLQVQAQDTPESLFRLVQDNIHYNDMTPLFAFGLLPSFDVPVLQALCATPEAQQ